MILSEKFKVDFLVIGVQKSGTSALDFYLRNHSEIGMGNKKELHFFDTDSYFRNSKVDYSIYHNQFTFNQENKIYGEITPSYIYWKNSIKRIKEYNPNIKIITLLRNPIERAYSHWNMSIKKKNENEDFITCIKKQIIEINENRCIQNLPNSYVDRGLYLKQIKEVMHHFSSDQLMFIKYEDFLSNQEKTLKKVFSFLNIEGMFNFQFQKKNKFNYSDNITREEKNTLLHFYKDEIKEIEELLDWDCKDWLK